MKTWRQQERARLNYDGVQYVRPELQWGQRSFIQPESMPATKWLQNRDLQTRSSGL